MKTLIKWIFKLFIALVLIVILVPIIGSILLDKNDVEQTLNDVVFESTGRNIHIDGNLGVRPGLNLTLFADDVRYDNADWGSTPSAFSAEKVEIEISLIELLSRKFSVRRVVITGGELWIEQKNEDLFNLIEAEKVSGGPTQPIPLPEWLDLNRVDIKNSKITYLHPKRDWEILLDTATATNAGKDQPMVVGIFGSVEQTPLSLQGTMGTLETWFSRTPSQVFLETRLSGDSVIEAEGEIDDVLDWIGLDIALRIDINRLQSMSTLFLNDPIDIRGIKASARLLQPERAHTMQLIDIDGRFSLYGVPMQGMGKVGALSQLEQIDLNIQANSAVDLAALPLEITTTIKPKVVLSARLQGESDKLQLEIEDGALLADHFSLKTRGKIDDLTGFWGEPLPLVVEVTDLLEIGKSFDKNLPQVGKIEASANLVKNDEGYSLIEIDINNPGPMVEFTGSGFLNNMGANQVGQLNIAGVSVAQLTELDDYKLPFPLDQINATGVLKVEQKLFRLENLDLNASMPGATLHASGGITDLSQIDSARLVFDGEIINMEKFGEANDAALPNLGPVKFSGVLEGDGDSLWNINDVGINVDQQELSLIATGSVGNLGEALNTNLLVKLDATASSAFSTFPALSKFKKYGEDFSEISSTFRVQSTDAKHWSISDLDWRGKWLGAELNLGGNIDSFSPQEGKLTVNLKGDLEKQPGFADVTIFPVIDAVDGRLAVILSGNETRITDIDVSVTGQKAALQLFGGVERLSPLNIEKLRVVVKAADLADVMPDDALMKPGNALDADLDLVVDQDQLTAAGVVQIGVSDLQAALNLSLNTEGQSSFNAVMTSERLDFKSLFHEGEKQPKLISDDPLFPGWMHEVDGKISLAATSFVSGMIQLEDLDFNAKLNAGSVTTSFSGRSGGGRLDGAVSVAKTGENKINLAITEFPVTSFSALADGELFVGGTIDSKIMLTGHGKSIAALVNSGSGEIALDISQSKIQDKALKTVGGDIVTNLVTIVNPFSDKEKFVDVECGSIRLDIADGKAVTRDGLAMKTHNVTVLGSGDITFPDETLKIVMTPKPRKGFGISASSVAKMIRVGGTLSKPKIEADAKGLLKSGVAIGAAIASGGLSLVAQGLLDRMRANSDVCALARGEKVELPEQQPQQPQKTERDQN